MRTVQKSITEENEVTMMTLILWKLLDTLSMLMLFITGRFPHFVLSEQSGGLFIQGGGGGGGISMAGGGRHMDGESQKLSSNKSSMLPSPSPTTD